MTATGVLLEKRVLIPPLNAEEVSAVPLGDHLELLEVNVASTEAGGCR
jgi:hypothetical protein